MPSISLLKAIAREIRYRELDFLIGQEIKLSTFESIESDLKEFLRVNLISHVTSLDTSPKTMSGTMAKYGFLDITFRVDPILLEQSCRSGLELLKDLRFIDFDATLKEVKDGFQEDAQIVTDNLICLEQLNESLSSSKTFLRIFLESERIKGKGSHMFGILPPDYLPKTFTIRDACIANSDFVWFHKYFYL